MIAFTGILLGMAASVMMQTILATVLPNVVKELGGVQLYSWVFSGYMVAATISIPIFAKLADLYGRKNFYIGGMVVFLVGSVLSGTANSMEQLVLYRVIQGLGAGAVAPAAIAIISDLFPIEERGKMMGVLAAVQVLANLAGPLLGGLLTDNFGWRWAFFAILPIGILAVMLITGGLSEAYQKVSQANLGQVDLIGGFLLGLGTVLLIKGFSQMGSQGLFHWQTGLILLSALVVFSSFLWQEKYHTDPVVPTSLIGTPNISVSLLSTFLLGAVMYGAIVILPIYGQVVLGGTAMQGGKLLLPLTFGVGLGGIIGGRLTKKLSYAKLAMGGWTMVTIGFLLLALTSRIGMTYFLLAGVVFITGLGLGVTLPTFLLPAQNAVAENQRAVVGGLVQISRNLGGAVGIPIFTGIIASGGGKIIGFTGLGSYFTVFILLTFGSALGVAVGLQFKGSVYQDQNVQRSL